MDYEAMGARIRALRKRNGLTQAQLAEAVHISTSFMGHIERGTRIASLDTLVRLSQVLDASLDVLVTGTDSRKASFSSGNRRMRMLNDVMRVLDEHAEEWVRE